MEKIPEPFTLVLGGGGAKGYAHLGVLKALEEKKHKPSLVVGTSMGALVGFLYCTGIPLERIIEGMERISKWTFFWLSEFSPWSLMWLFSLGPLEEKLRKETGDPRFEDLPIRLAVVAVEAHTGRKHIFREGNVVDGVLASIAVPGYFRPLKRNGKFWVDGGLIEPLPILSARELGKAFIVAVDVWSRRDTPLYSLHRPYNLFTAAAYSIDILLLTLNQQAHQYADLLILPNCSDIHWMHFHRAKEAITRGYEEANEVLSDSL